MTAQLLALTADLPVQAAAPVLDRRSARRRAQRIRGLLKTSVDELLCAWRDLDQVALGYGAGLAGWQAYVAGEYEDLEFRLPASLRRPRLLAMRTAGMSTDVITATPGMGAKGTVIADLAWLRAQGLLDDAEATTTSIDGSRRAARTGATARRRVHRTNRLVEVITAAGPGGLTVVGVCEKARMPRHVVAPALTRLFDAGRIGYLAPERRGQFGTWVPVPELVEDLVEDLVGDVGP